MDVELMVERIALRARCLLETIQDRDADAILEEFGIVCIIAVPGDDGVAEEAVSMFSTSAGYAQEGILHAALREHDRKQREDPPEPE